MIRKESLNKNNYLSPKNKICIIKKPKFLKYILAVRLKINETKIWTNIEELTTQKNNNNKPNKEIKMPYMNRIKDANKFYLDCMILLKGIENPKSIRL